MLKAPVSSCRPGTTMLLPSKLLGQVTCRVCHAGRGVAYAVPRPATAPSWRTQAVQVAEADTFWETDTVPPPIVLIEPGVAAVKVAPTPPTTKLINVAHLDAQKFQLHSSVEYWRNFATKYKPMFDDAQGSSDTPGLDSLMRRVMRNADLRDPQSAAFWAYHTARMTFFIGQAVASLGAHHLAETFAGTPSGQRTPMQRMMANGTSELVNRVTEALAVFSQDYENISNGAYKLPWDMTTPGHRQFNPLFLASRTSTFMSEAISTLQRRIRQTPEDVWMQSNMYPQYYLKTFHFQTDGWFSDRSANVYEHSTEVLFFGRQDAMQRTSLLPIAEWMRGREANEVRLLEVAAGTGRFHTFIKDNYPDMRSTCNDLSPFYLAKARENIEYWKSQRQPTRPLGGVGDSGVDFLQAPAEKLPEPDASYDIVVCVYLFHELPEPVRRKAVREMYRVLKPGGLCVFTDSVQRGDRPDWDATIGLFANFNEPHYPNYVHCDLGAMFQEAGFTPTTKYMSSATKTLAFTKPLVQHQPQEHKQGQTVAVAPGIAAMN